MRYKHGSIWKPAIVISNHTAPRLYIIQTANGMILRWNRCHLKRTNEHVKIAPSYDDDDVIIVMQSIVYMACVKLIITQ